MTVFLDEDFPLWIVVGGSHVPLTGAECRRNLPRAAAGRAKTLE
jgi:hypothetical protein